MAPLIPGVKPSPPLEGITVMVMPLPAMARRKTGSDCRKSVFLEACCGGALNTASYQAVAPSRCSAGVPSS